MTVTSRDFSRFESDEVRLKFWLPDKLDRVLAELQQAMAVSRSTLVRMTLFQHLYGRYDYVAMQVMKQGFFAPKIGGGYPAFSRPNTKRISEKSSVSAARVDIASSRQLSSSPLPRGGRTPELRKNQCDVTVFLPACIKDDLIGSAERLGIPLSLHVREILISQLLGREYLTDRDSYAAVEPEGHETHFESRDRFDPDDLPD